jgi:ubiquinol-cytochrome c reductase iron-sulfur subunit
LVIEKDANQSQDSTRRRVSRRGFLGLVVGFAAGFATAFYALPKSLWLGNLRMKLRTAEHPGPDIEVNIQSLQPGQSMVTGWKERTVLIQRRTDEMLRKIEAGSDRLRDPDSSWSTQPDGAQNPFRSIRPELFVVDVTCTHLGCPVSEIRRGQLQNFDFDGFVCVCHGGQFDLSGRVFKGNPAPLNLRVPPHHFTDENTVIIGSTAS